MVRGIGMWRGGIMAREGCTDGRRCEERGIMVRGVLMEGGVRREASW